jgi:hypothetical protein
VNQNSLERLLEGIAAALRESVAPALEDRYARAQAECAAELLLSLAPRIDWRAEIAEAELRRIRPLLRRATLIADPEALPRTHAFLSAGSGLSAEATRCNALLALAEVQTLLGQRESDDALAADIRSFARWQLDGQASRLPPRIPPTGSE